ncbi:MAG: BatA and WFA domain-containing protein [Chthoniobacteraceae bacterium]
MSFTALSSAWLFALLIPLVVFYFLKLKRPRQIIPSLVLWRQVLSDQRVNSPFQRFRRNLLLLLQILLLTLLALAAMQPLLRREAKRSARLPILVDVSASMGALDKAGGRSRLDEAKRRLIERIESLPPDQELCLVAFAKSARKLTGFTNNRTELRDAVRALEAEDVPGDLEEALRLAQALARTSPFDRVLVLTDANLPAKTNFELPFQLELQKLPPAGPNAGITAFNARRSGSGDWELFIQLGVTDPAPAATATVELQSGGQTIAKEQVALTPGGGPRLAFRVSGVQNATVHAVLRPDGFDSLAADNDAWLTLPAVRPLDVFVPESLTAFRHALAALDGIRIFPSKDTPSPSSFDLAITDKPGAPPSLLLCTVGFVPEDIAPLVSMGKKSVAAIDWRRESPLLQHVSLDEVIFMDDPVASPGKDETAFANLGYEILAQGPHGPLALVRNDDSSGTAQVHLLFNPDHSTLPFRVAFPIFTANLAGRARSLAGLSDSAAVATGVLPPQSFPANANVTASGPSHFTRTERADGRGTVSGVPAPRVGEYTFISGGTVRTAGASLLSAAETGLAAVNEVEFGDRISVATASVATKSDRSLWWPLALAGSVVLLVEWWWFQRRALA